MGWKVQKRRKGRYRRFHHASQGLDVEAWSKLYGDRRTILGPRASAIHNKKSSMVQPTWPSDADKVFSANTSEVIVRYFGNTPGLDPRMDTVVKLSMRRVQAKYMGEKEFNWISIAKLGKIHLKLFFQGECFVFIQHMPDKILVSHTYGSRKSAMRAWEDPNRSITWDKTKTIRLELPP